MRKLNYALIENSETVHVSLRFLCICTAAEYSCPGFLGVVYGRGSDDCGCPPHHSNE